MLTQFYIHPDNIDRDALWYGHLSRDQWPGYQPITLIDYATFSDYSGGSVEQSNYRVMLDDPDLKGTIVEVYGSHGTKAIGYLGTKDDPPECLSATLAALDSYPLLSDDDHSELEMALETEAWDDYGREDFRSALVGVLDTIDPDHEHDIDDLSDDTLFEIWRDGCEAYNVEGGSGCHVETGGSVYFDIDEWVARAGESPDQTWSEWGLKARRKMRDTLLTLATEHRISEDD